MDIWTRAGCATSERPHVSVLHDVAPRLTLIGLQFEKIVQCTPLDATAIGITAVLTHEWPTVVGLDSSEPPRMLPEASQVPGNHLLTTLDQARRIS